MKKLRLLLLDTGKEWGGGTNSMFELLKRIDRERFDINALFYRNYRKGESSDLKTEFAAIGIPLEIEPPIRQPLWAKIAKELVRGLCRPFPRIRQRILFAIERLWRINPTANRLAARLHQGAYDLLYMNNQPSSNLEGYLSAEMAGVPAVQHCRIEATLQEEEIRIANRVARRILCVSEGVRDSLVAQGICPELCRVVHNAIDGRQKLPPAAQLPSFSSDTVVIGTIGSLIKRKSIDQLLRASALVAMRCSHPFCMLIVGEGPEHDRLVSLTKSLKLEKRIVFAGFQQQPLAWTAAMDIVTLTSAKEGLPRVILEAMLLSKPVIASDIVGSRELVIPEQTGLLYPYGDEEILARHLQRLIENRDIRHNMGASGRSSVLQSYSIEKYVDSVEQQLQEASA